MIVDVHAHIYPEVRGKTGAGPTQGLAYGRVTVGDKQIWALPPFCEKTVFSAEALIAQMDFAGVDKAFLLQGSFYGECNDYIMAAVRRYPSRLGAAAYFDPWEKNPRRHYDAIISRGGFKAVKLECSVSTGFCGLYPDARLDDLDLEWLWGSLEKQGLVLVLDLGEVASKSYQTEGVKSVAGKHPDLKIVIAHLAQPNPNVMAQSKLFELWKKQIDLGKMPNVWFDNAALPAYLPGEEYPFPTSFEYMKMVIDRIGPAKVMWGTDIPGLLLQASYPELLSIGRKQIAFLVPKEQEMIFGGNALEVFCL